MDFKQINGKHTQTNTHTHTQQKEEEDGNRMFSVATKRSL